MPAVSRIGDATSCGDLMQQGSGNVFANGIPVSRADKDLTAGHAPGSNQTQIASGSSTVFVNGKPVTRLGDPIKRHFFPGADRRHGGSLVIGSPTVFAGG